MTTDHAPGARSTSAVSYHKRQHGSSKTHPLRFCRQQPACTTAPGARRTKDEVPDTADLGCPSSHEIGKLKLGVVFARHRKLDHLRGGCFFGSSKVTVVRELPVGCRWLAQDDSSVKLCLRGTTGSEPLQH